MSRVYDATLPDGLFEINGSRTETYNDTEFNAHIEYVCVWEYRNWYVSVLHDKVYPKYLPILADGTTDTSYYNWYYPAQAISCSVSNMGAEGVTVAPAYNAESQAYFETHYQSYTRAKISVDYKGIARPGAWSVQESITPTYSGRQLPSWGFYWRSDGSPIMDNETPFIQELMIDINRTITGVRQLPWWFYGLGGKTNFNAWTDVFTGEAFLPDTLLFIPSSLQRQITYNRSDDDNIWSIGFSLKYNPIGWNSFRRPHGVDMMMRNGAPVFLYGKGVFPNLCVTPEDVMAGEPYTVIVENENGTQQNFQVDSYGNVTWGE